MVTGEVPKFIASTRLHVPEKHSLTFYNNRNVTITNIRPTLNAIQIINIYLFIITNTMRTIGVDKITLFKTT